MDQLTYANLLHTHEVVITFVCSWLCTGLADIVPVPTILRLDISASPLMTPPMHPEAHPDGLHVTASFNRVSRALFVPWEAIVWAGLPEEYAQALKRNASRACDRTPASPAPKREHICEIIRVDFKRRRVIGRERVTSVGAHPETEGGAA